MPAKQDPGQGSLFSPGSGAGPDYTHEQALISRYGLPVCGVDEVGRGPIAGPVVAAAVILDLDTVPDGLADSKKLSKTRLKSLDELIHKQAIAVSIAQASVAEIDQINILAASLLAMRRAVEGLSPRPVAALVDGNQDPGLAVPTNCLIKGDSRSVSVAAASIVAKVFRDQLMADLAKDFPDYGWDQNAGYGVAKHRAALDLVGVSPHHRHSFEPIRSILNE